jgi:hypothetical protein
VVKQHEGGDVVRQRLNVFFGTSPVFSFTIRFEIVVSLIETRYEAAERGQSLGGISG